MKLLTRTKLSLIEFLPVAPPEVFVHYITTIAVQSRDMIKEVPKLDHFWGTLVRYVFSPNSPPAEQLGCPYQELRSLILSSIPVIYKKGGLVLLEQVFGQLPDLQITPDELFLMYCQIE